MSVPAVKNDIVQQLQREILSLQNGKRAEGTQALNTGLGVIEMAFPGHTFPTGVVHEFMSTAGEDAAATNGFISALLGKLMQQKGSCLWVGAKRTIFPPALKIFGIDPSRIIFIDLYRQKDILWAIEEALKCEALTAVVGELSTLNFTESRRLQLAVEQSKVTGLIHRSKTKTENTVACVTRWKITPIVSATDNAMPGIGHPRWNVQLQKVRNGKPGTWQIEWNNGDFRHIARQALSISVTQTRKAG